MFFSSHERQILGIERRCRKQGVPFFFKQWGSARKNATSRTLNGRTCDYFPIARRQAAHRDQS